MPKLVFVLESESQSLEPVEKVSEGDVTILILVNPDSFNGAGGSGGTVDDFLERAQRRVDLLKGVVSAKGVTLSSEVAWGAKAEVVPLFLEREGAQLLSV